MPLLILLASIFCLNTANAIIPRPGPGPIPIPTPLPPKKIILPHARYTTLQSAVDAVAEGGEIVLNPGSYSGANGNSKKISITGSAGRNDVVINGKIEVGTNGDASISNLTINSSDGLGLVKSNNQTSLIVSNVRINNGGLTSVGNATIQKLEINNPQTGLTLSQFSRLILKTVDVNNASAFGIWTQGNDNCSVDLALVGIRKSARQGIVLKGRNCNGTAQYLRVEDAKLAGVQVENYNSLLINASTVLRTVAGFVKGSLPINVRDDVPSFGDAVLTLWSNVTLQNNNLNNNYRAGASILGCNAYKNGSLEMGNSNLFANGMDLFITTVAFPGGNNDDCSGAGTLNDLGGNQCGPNADNVQPCRAQSTSIEPIPV